MLQTTEAGDTLQTHSLVSNIIKGKRKEKYQKKDIIKESIIKEKISSKKKDINKEEKNHQ